jgi:hypothetical protein
MMSATDSLSRRTFLTAAAAGAACLGASRAFAQDAAAVKPEGAAMTKFKYWMHGMGSDPKACAKAFKEAGFHVVVGGAAPTIEAIRAEGMEAWLCGGAFGFAGLEKEPGFAAIDVTGQPRVWFGSGCPNSDTLRSRNLKSYEALAATADIQGILVDGCRFASPASGLDAYFTCFCDVCRTKAGKVGCDFERMKRDVGALREQLLGKGGPERRGTAWMETPVGVLEWLTQHPGVFEWLRFRRLCISEHFGDIGKIIHAAKLRMGVYIFTPSLAPLVGQSWVDLAEFVDVFAPMIYRNYPDKPGEACINWELTNIPEALGLSGAANESAVMKMVLNWFGLPEMPLAIKDIRAALPPEAVGQQVKLARSILGPEKELAPIIYIDDPLMKQTADLVRSNGANGLNFFVYKDTWADMVRPAIV